MKNFIIGLMVGMWVGPILKEVTYQLAEKNHVKLEAARRKSPTKVEEMTHE